MDRDAVDDDRVAWARDSIERLWSGATIARIDTLRGDASARRFSRLILVPSKGPASAILVDLGPDDLPRYARVLGLVREPPAEPPWINVHRFLIALGIAVPALYAFSASRRALLIEDVGETALFDLLRARRPDSADLLRLAVENLLALHVEGTRRIDSRCVAAKIAYDARLFRWEMLEFTEIGCARVAPEVDPVSLEPELDSLARELGKFPRVLSHRDYHGHNLFVQNDGRHTVLRVIDFQDALMAPAAQDLAVLLTTRDTGSLIASALEEKLLHFYYTGLVRRGAADLPFKEFMRSYRLCVLQHALKMIGRFLLFERDGKFGYTEFLPHTIAQARRILDGPDGSSFPRLAASMQLADNLRLAPEKPL